MEKIKLLLKILSSVYSQDYIFIERKNNSESKVHHKEGYLHHKEGPVFKKPCGVFSFSFTGFLLFDFIQVSTGLWGGISRFLCILVFTGAC